MVKVVNMQADINRAEKCISDELMADFLAGELAQDAAAKVDQHLAACELCRKEAGSFREIASLIADDKDDVDCDLTDAVMARIADDAVAVGKPTGRIIPFVWSLARVAALLIAALVLGITMRGLLDVNGKSGNQMAVAVNDAAKWLVSVQDEDGSWDPGKWGGRKELGASLTGLAMLTILRSDIEAGDALAKAQKYLLSVQNKDGSFGPECVGRMYNHGIASKALLAMREAGHATAKEPLEHALAYMLKTQSPTGGWSYREGDSRNSSMGVSVWQLDALLAGRAAGIDGLDQGLRKGISWLKGIYSGAGDFNYRSGIESGDMSATVKAMGAMCMLSADKDVLGMFDSGKINDALSVAMGDGVKDDLYHSYFLTSAAKAGHRKDLTAKIEGLSTEILNKRVIGGLLAGSWDADGRWGSVGGRVYSTSMAALSLSNGRIGEI